MVWLLLCQAFICVQSAHVSGTSYLVRHEVSSDARIASQKLHEVIDEDGDTFVISHCESLRSASFADYATCRWAAGRLGRSFHFGAASPGCQRRLQSPSTALIFHQTLELRSV